MYACMKKSNDRVRKKVIITYSVTVVSDIVTEITGT